MPIDTDPILSRIEDYLKETGMSATAFGNQVMRDPMLVFDLRSGRELRRETRNRIEAFMKAASKAA